MRETNIFRVKEPIVAVAAAVGLYRDAVRGTQELLGDKRHGCAVGAVGMCWKPFTVEASGAVAVSLKQVYKLSAGRHDYKCVHKHLFCLKSQQAFSEH